MADDEYEYTNERSIDADLKCPICCLPFNDPYVTQCNHIYCLECIIHWLRTRTDCPICRQPIKRTDLEKDDSVSNAANQLFVTCKKCQQSDIRRNQFDDHRRNCSFEVTKQVSSNGHNVVNSHHIILDNQRIESLINQPLRQNQRFKEELQRQRNEIYNNNNQINNNINTINVKLEKQQDEIQTLKQLYVRQQRKIQEFERIVQIQKDKIERQQNFIDQLKTDNRRFQNLEYRLRNLEERSHHDELEDYITKKCEFGSEFVLREWDLIDCDMKIIVKRVIIDKQCSALNLERNKITYEGVSIIADVFDRNIRLKKLNLSYNNISDRGIQYLSQALLQKTSLEELYLGSTGITNQGIKYLIEMLQSNRTLKKLYLYENDFDDDGMKLLTNVFSKYNRTLNELSLYSNKLITDRSVNAIIDMFKENQSLEKIYINQCDFSNTAKTRLQDAAKREKIMIEI